MFTEQKEYVHLVDARTFEKTQILNVGEPEDGIRDPDIGGACFSPDGKSVVVGGERSVCQWVQHHFSREKLKYQEIDTRGRKLFPSVELY